MIEHITPPGNDAAGIDPTYTPAMQSLLMRYAANRLAVSRSREALDQVRSEFASLATDAEVPLPQTVKAAGETLATSPDDKRRAPFEEFTDALVDLADQYPPGGPERAALFSTVDLSTQLMAKAQQARSDELAALLRLNTLARDIEAQHAFERHQGGGIH